MTIFTTTSYPVGALIADIDLGKVGLPDLQRPFVWRNVKVRNLLDSLYKGYRPEREPGPVTRAFCWSQPVHDGSKVESCHTDPISQRRAVNVDARAGEDL